MSEFESYKKEAEKIIKSLGKRNDLSAQLLRLKIREKLCMLEPDVGKDTNTKELITFVGVDDEGNII